MEKKSVHGRNKVSNYFVPNSKYLQEEISCTNSSDEKAASSSNQSDEITSGPKPKTRAVIWDFFEKVDEMQAKCNTCTKIYKTPSSSTSSLIRHLDVHKTQKRKFDETVDLAKQAKPKLENKTSIASAFTKQLSLPANSGRARLITSKICKMIVQDYQPLSIVNDNGFQELMNTLEPRYQIPTRKQFSRVLIPELFHETKTKVSNILCTDIQHAESLSFTMDLWTSRSHDPYLSLTAHYLTTDFIMKNMTLQCSHFPGEHTGSAIHGKVVELLKDWKISDEVVPLYVVSDNARNLISAFSFASPEITHTFCMAHTLQLGINDAVAEAQMGSLLKKCRSIVGHYKSSTKSRERLESLQLRLGLPQHSLCQMVETRWNSTYMMLDRLLEQREAVSADIAKSGKDNLTATEWQLIESYVLLLKPMFQATQELCKEDTPTLSMVLPLIYSLEEGLKQYINCHIGDLGSGMKLARSLSKSFAARFYETKQSMTHKLAPVLILDTR